ncbi:MAG: BTAD domain-containing putative transcriptional regulator [Anaerovorax sp.]
MSEKGGNFSPTKIDQREKYSEFLPIRVNMLGRFSLSMGGQVILEDQGQSKKVWNLFAYLIANRHRVLGPTELLDLLCSDERSDDPSKAVKNLVYRLRRILNNSPLPKADYIVQKGGIYRWNEKIPLEVDVDLFQQKWKDAKKLYLDDESSLQNYLEAISLYEGRFLPRFIYEEWTVSLATQYQRIFMECVSSAFTIIEKRKGYEAIIPICERAILMDPFDEEIYTIYIKSLTKLNRQREALNAYEAITDKLYSEMGVNPSKELTHLYKSMLKTLKNVETDLISIKEDLNERRQAEGAYYCEYEIFKDLYRFMMRSVERSGESIYIMLCTLTNENDGILDVEAEHVGKAMEKLKEAISQTLRKGDVFARYSCSQYVVMLPNITCDNSEMVEERIANAYRKQYASKFVKLHFKLQPLISTWE